MYFDFSGFHVRNIGNLKLLHFFVTDEMIKYFVVVPYLALFLYHIVFIENLAC